MSQNRTTTPLYQYFRDAGISLHEIAERTGYSYQHIVELLNGTERLSDSARFRFIAAYPETATILLPGNGNHHPTAVDCRD